MRPASRSRTAFRRRIGFDINGRDGKSLYDHWATASRRCTASRARGFPNWFYIGISQNALSVNMTAMFDDQATHIAYIIAEARNRGASEVEPTAEARGGVGRRHPSPGCHEPATYLEACTPGYYNNEGDLTGGLGGPTPITPGINGFNALLAEWREKGDLEGLRLLP